MTAPAVIPPPDPQLPICSLCWEETTHDGETLSCLKCGVYWGEDWGKPGWRIDGDTPQCAAEISPWPDDVNLGNVKYRCLLTEGHKSLHAGTRSDKEGDITVGTFRWQTYARKAGR